MAPTASSGRSRRRRQQGRRGGSSSANKPGTALPRPERGAPSPADEDATANEADAAVEPVQAAAPAGAAPSIRPKRTAPQKAATPREERSFFYRMTHPIFVSDIFSELRKVVWPSASETRSLTTVVLVVAVAVAAFLGAVDWGFSRIMENVLLP